MKENKKNMSLTELKDIAWQSAQVVEGYNPDRIRKDACGAWIAYVDFNNHDSLFGWEIDHIYPVFRLKVLGIPEKKWDHPLNIRALHWQNNLSKGDSYPMYTAVLSDEGATNIKCEAIYWVNEVLQYSLRKLFKITE